MRLQRQTKLGLLGIAFLMALVFAPSDRRALYADTSSAKQPAPPAQQTPPPAQQADEDEVEVDEGEVTLTGCLVQGEEGGEDGFLLTEVLPSSIDQSTRQAAELAQPEGTAGNELPGASSVIYWLDDIDDDDEAAGFAGSRVEIRGELGDEIDRGEMEIEREGDWVEIDIESGGKKVSSRLPFVSVMPNPQSNAVGTSGGLKEDEDIELNVNVRKLDVKEVKVVSGTCR
jgi:hypothetical protein